MADPSPAAAMRSEGWLAAVKAWWPAEAADAVRLGLAAVAAIWLSMRFSLQAPHWAGWTVVSVTLASRAASLRKSLWRAFSTIVGVVAALVLVGNFAQQTLAFDIAIALWLGLLTAASTIESGQRSYGFALMGFTVPIIAFANVEHPLQTFNVGVDRCSTILLGILCAYAANVVVAPGVPEVASSLAGRLEAAADACTRWLGTAAEGRDPGPMPSGLVAALSEVLIDGFTEQPSLRFGGHAAMAAPSRLRHALAAGLMRAALPGRDGVRSTTLLGDEADHAVRQIDRVRVAARMLREGRRFGNRRLALRPRLLLWNDLDWDGVTARNNAIRTMVAVSVVNGFWYVTGWSVGASAATWAGLLSILLASRPDPVASARAFVVGVPVAITVGLVVRYMALTATGAFPYLAAVLLPVMMLAVVGRSDPRAKYGVGYGFLVLGVIDPTNVMTYDLSASLNQALAEMLGMGFAVISFTALPPPADAEALRQRAKARLVRGIRAAALNSRWLLPPRERWLARGFGQLATIVTDNEPHRDAQALLLVGLLLLAMRRDDDRLGLMVGRCLFDHLLPDRGQESADPRPALERLAKEARCPALAAERIVAIGTLAAHIDLAGWLGRRCAGGCAA